MAGRTAEAYGVHGGHAAIAGSADDNEMVRFRQAASVYGMHTAISMQNQDSGSR